MERKKRREKKGEKKKTVRFPLVSYQWGEKEIGNYFIHFPAREGGEKKRGGGRGRGGKIFLHSGSHLVSRKGKKGKKERLVHQLSIQEGRG